MSVHTNIANANIDTTGASVSSLIASGNAEVVSNKVNSGLVPSIAAAAASGVSALPGGASSLGAVINQSSAISSKLPGISSITDAVSGGIDGALGGALGKVNGLKDSLLGKLGGGALAGIEGALGSLASQGSSFKLPISAFNTLDKSALIGQTSSLLGNPKIPLPNFDVGALTKRTEKLRELQKAPATNEIDDILGNL
tara:strand:- start:2031 stop:2624 length:594 start_codon:yes stop_codon:yes gene_type:complete